MNGTVSDVVGRVSLTTNCRTLTVSNIVTPARAHPGIQWL